MSLARSRVLSPPLGVARQISAGLSQSTQGAKLSDSAGANGILARLSNAATRTYILKSLEMCAREAEAACVCSWEDSTVRARRTSGRERRRRRP